MGFGINIINSGAKYSHGDATGIKATPVRYGINAKSETRDNNDAFFCERIGEFIGNLLTIPGIVPRANDGDGFRAACSGFLA